MQYIFFYASIAAVWVLLLAGSRFRPLRPRHILVGAASACYSFLFDCFFGEYLKLYYYISPGRSFGYILLSALLLYPEIDMLYLLFLPGKIKAVPVYTALWIAALVLFELGSLSAHTVVFTGWRLFPWSILTYIFSFLWLNCLYRYLENKGL